MKVTLVSTTNSKVEGINSAEELMVYAARVSSPNNQLNTDTGAKLLKYCLTHKHFSIFEMADMTVEITTSRAIAQQILRHRSFTFQEFSQRYAKASMGFESYSARRQDIKNRQNSIDDMNKGIKDWFGIAQAEIQLLSECKYAQALEMGIAKEQARFLLPSSTTTKLYMKGNVRSWLHYLESRTDGATQLEHREVAEAIKSIFIEQFPIVSESLGWSNTDV